MFIWSVNLNTNVKFTNFRSEIVYVGPYRIGKIGHNDKNHAIFLLSVFVDFTNFNIGEKSRAENAKGK